MQAQHEQEARKLEAEVQQLQTQRQRDAKKLQAEQEQLRAQHKQELQELQTKVGLRQGSYLCHLVPKQTPDWD